MKSCSKCGMQMKDEDVFCFGCGHKYVEDDTDFSFYGTPQRIIDERIEAEKIERDDDVAFYGEATKKPEAVFVPTGNICKSCGAELNEGDAFCMNCGAKCEALSAPAKLCINCAAPLDEADMFCMNCGAKQVQEVREEPAPVIAPEPPAPEKRICAVCGNEMEEGFMFCIKCGAKADAGTETIKTENRFCMNCGSKLNEGDVFCMNCGTKV